MVKTELDNESPCTVLYKEEHVGSSLHDGRRPTQTHHNRSALVNFIIAVVRSSGELTAGRHSTSSRNSSNNMASDARHHAHRQSNNSI